MGRARHCAAQRRRRASGIRGENSPEAAGPSRRSLRAGAEVKAKTSKRIYARDKSHLTTAAKVARAIRCEAELFSHLRARPGSPAAKPARKPSSVRRAKTCCQPFAL